MDRHDPRIITSNRDAWNDSARHHKGTEGWQRLLADVTGPRFSCLDETLSEVLLGVGVAGKEAVQLGCNNGRECLSLFSLGARHVVGVDQAHEFLEQARELTARSPHALELVEANVYALPVELHNRFDLALVTIGVLGWMPDIAGFFTQVAATLKVGGTLVIYETHPFLEMFEPEAAEPFALATSYFRREPFVQEQAIVYEGKAEGKSPASYWFVHTLGDIFGAAIAAGLQISHFKEYPHSNREELYDQYEDQVAQLPMSYTLMAVKA